MEVDLWGSASKFDMFCIERLQWGTLFSICGIPNHLTPVRAIL